MASGKFGEHKSLKDKYKKVLYLFEGPEGEYVANVDHSPLLYLDNGGEEAGGGVEKEERCGGTGYEVGFFFFSSTKISLRYVTLLCALGSEPSLSPTLLLFFLI